MRKTKILGATLLVGLAALSLSSCGGEDDSRTIMFYNTFGDKLQTNINTAIAKFEETYPGWKVTSNGVGGYDELYSTIVKDLQANTVPDLATCYSDHVAYYLSSGKVLNMSDYINSTEKLSYTDKDGNLIETDTTIGYSATELEDFVSSYYVEGRAENFANYAAQGFKADDMLTLPFSKSTELMYYNSTALIAAGIKNADGTAKVPTTWAELWDACEIIKNKYPNSTPLAYDSEANWFITMCEQNGWDYTSASDPHYLFNNANTRGWLEDLADKYEDGLFTTQTIYGSYTSTLFTSGVDKGCVFCIGSSGGASYQSTSNFKWGVAQIPGTKASPDAEADMSCISQGPSLVMLDNGDSEKAKMTWEFVKMILDPKFQASYSMTSGYNPVRVSTFDIPEYDEFIKGTSITAKAASVAKSLSDQNAFYTSPAFRGSSDARLQVGTALNYAIQGVKTAEEALADAVKKCGGQ